MDPFHRDGWNAFSAVTMFGEGYHVCRSRVLKHTVLNVIAVTMRNRMCNS